MTDLEFLESKLDMERVRFTEYESREDWLAERAKRIGASEAAVLCGISKWTSPFALFHTKRGLAPEKPETEAQYWGHKLEPAIAARYESETGRELVDPGEYTIFTHADFPALHATPDRFVMDPVRGLGVLELKNRSRFADENWTEEVPLEVQVQIQVQLACTGLSLGSVAVLIGGNQWHFADVERNEDFIAKLESVAEGFLERIAADDPPPLDDSPHTARAVKALYPPGSGDDVCVYLPDEMSPVHIELEDIANNIKSLQAREDELKARVCNALGKAARPLVLDGELPPMGLPSNIVGKVSCANGNVVEYSWKTQRTAKASIVVDPAYEDLLADSEIPYEFKEERTARVLRRKLIEAKGE